jgi:hypothetical protein
MPLITFVDITSGIDEFGNPIAATETTLGTVTVMDEDLQHYQDGVDINMTNNWEYPVEIRRLFLEPVPSFGITVYNKLYVDNDTNPYKIIEKKAFDSHLELVILRKL